MDATNGRRHEDDRAKPIEFRTGQRAQWNSAASGWKKWSPLIDKDTAPVSERLVEPVQVDVGDRVLDVAAGYGEPALTAAMRVGPDGRVVATDISGEMLAFGRERAAAAGVENVEFVEADAASLDFPARASMPRSLAGGSSSSRSRRRRPLECASF